MDNLIIKIEHNPGIRLLLKNKKGKVKLDKLTNEKQEIADRLKKEALNVQLS